MRPCIDDDVGPAVLIDVRDLDLGGTGGIFEQDGALEVPCPLHVEINPAGSGQRNVREAIVVEIPHGKPHPTAAVCVES